MIANKRLFADLQEFEVRRTGESLFDVGIVGENALEPE